MNVTPVKEAGKAATGKEHIAVVHGSVAEREDCPVRVHRECLTVTRRIPMVIQANEHNGRSLQTRRERLGHLLD